MDSITLMVDEHENILRLNAVLRRACEQILDGGQPCVADFRQMIDFIRNYADKHHHGKEEQILFLEMQAKLGDIAVNLVKHGMLVEHDLGRLFISELDAALDRYESAPDTAAKLEILASAMGYVNLLARHITKENAVVYPYARKHLPAEVLADIHVRTAAFERDADARGVPNRYLSMLAALEAKYLPPRTPAAL